MLELQFTKQKRTIKAEKGETIRETAIRNKLSIYPHIFKILNCRGRGLCHSCAIKIVSGNAEPKNENRLYPLICLKPLIRVDFKFLSKDKKICFN